MMTDPLIRPRSARKAPAATVSAILAAAGAPLTSPAGPVSSPRTATEP